MWKQTTLQQGTVTQVQAGLRGGGHALQGGLLFFHGQGGQIDLPQQVGLLLRRGMLLLPVTLAAGEAQPQGVVVRRQVVQRPAPGVSVGGHRAANGEQ